MYGSMEESPPAAAPALGPEEVKFVRKLMATNGDDARSAGLSHESHARTLVGANGLILQRHSPIPGTGAQSTRPQCILLLYE